MKSLSDRHGKQNGRLLNCRRTHQRGAYPPRRQRRATSPADRRHCLQRRATAPRWVGVGDQVRELADPVLGNALVMPQALLSEAGGDYLPNHSDSSRWTQRGKASPSFPRGTPQACNRSLPRPSTSLFKSRPGRHTRMLGSPATGNLRQPCPESKIYLFAEESHDRVPIAYYRWRSREPKRDFASESKCLDQMPITVSASSHNPSLPPNRATIATARACRPMTLEPQAIDSARCNLLLIQTLDASVRSRSSSSSLPPSAFRCAVLHLHICSRKSMFGTREPGVPLLVRWKYLISNDLRQDDGPRHTRSEPFCARLCRLLTREVPTNRERRTENRERRTENRQESGLFSISRQRARNQ